MKIPRSLLYNRLIGVCRLVVLVAAIALPANAFAQGNSSTPAKVSAYLPLLVQIESEQPGQPDSNPPVIKSFTATPAAVEPGGKATLIWQVSGADTLSIQPALGVLSGASVEVSPATATEYSLTATNAHGATTAKATVTVQAAGNDFQYNTFLLPYDIDKNAFVSKVPQLRIDQKNGVHVIYTASYPDDAGVLPAFYAYCPANCTSAGAFTVTHFGDNVDSAQLALDSQGHPRVLLATEPASQEVASKIHRIYGECNANCTNAANWSFTEIAAAHSYWGFADMESQQSFTLDAQGNPRFIYYADYFGAPENQPIGTVFAYCDGGCTNNANWYSTILSDETWNNPALLITSTGLPRIAYVLSGAEFSQVGYAECTKADCTKHNANNNIVANSSATLALSEYTFALRLDSHDRPRLAYYPGYGDSGTLPGIRAYYITCDAKQCTQPGTWNAIDIGLPAKTPSGMDIWQGDSGIDLQFDAQDRPRIALRMGYTIDELAYVYCNSGCLDSAANWTYYILWSTAAQADDMGLPPQQGCPDCHPPIPPCPVGFWDAGYWPSLALDSAGNPRIAYEIEEQTGGGYCTAATWARMSRFAIFDQP